jgi:hypothetical protein
MQAFNSSIVLSILFVSFPLAAESEGMENAGMYEHPAMETLAMIDSLIDVELLAILAGLSIASAAFMLTTRSHLDQQLGEKEILLEREKNERVQRQVNSLYRKRYLVQSGIQYLIAAHAIFIGTLLSILLIFDTAFDITPSASSWLAIVTGLFEIVPFLVGIGFLLAGAGRIREIFS